VSATPPTAATVKGTEISVDILKTHVGERVTIDGIEIGRVVRVEGDFTTMPLSTATVVSELLYWHLMLMPRPLTAQSLPCHDAPVAWRVDDHPYARIGIPVIAAPSLPPQGDPVVGGPRYMDPELVILDAEPGEAIVRGEGRGR